MWLVLRPLLRSTSLADAFAQHVQELLRLGVYPVEVLRRLPRDMLITQAYHTEITIGFYHERTRVGELDNLPSPSLSPYSFTQAPLAGLWHP